MSAVTLFDYWRSSASYRVRIALNLAGIDYEAVPIDIFKGDQRSDVHLARNPQGFVPVLEIDGLRLTQSLAIIEYLDETRGLALLPPDPALKAKVRALAHAVAIDIHPICNSSVSAHVSGLLNGQEGVREAWMARFIAPGLRALETMLEAFEHMPYCTGATPSLADLCLMPQIYNANRWGVDWQDCRRIASVVEACGNHPAFQAAHPDRTNV